jgi:hypothetical protein
MSLSVTNERLESSKEIKQDIFENFISKQETIEHLHQIVDQFKRPKTITEYFLLKLEIPISLKKILNH